MALPASAGHSRASNTDLASRPLNSERSSYAPAFPPIDFFRSLGRVRTINLNHFWYKDENNNFSNCRIPYEEKKWQDQYWRTFSAGSLYKTSEWSDEKEYRLVLHSIGFDLREKLIRKLRYKFEDLAGIIFGARTELEKKLAIMRIIAEKCSATKRSDFEFHEVRYEPGSSSFRLAPLSLLKIAEAGDPAETAALCCRAAEQGDAAAQFELGVMYQLGQGVQQDHLEAWKRFRKAAEQGDADALLRFGFRYELGTGLEQDYAEAARWYQMAADKGSAGAQFRLGIKYRLGQGLSQNYISAHAWLNLAASQGHREARTNRDQVAKMMSGDQIADAERLAAELKVRMGP